MSSRGTVDRVDWQILQELQEDARVTYTELGRRVGLTAPAVADRVRRLEEAGVITGYRAQVNLEKVGLPILAIVRMTSREGNCLRMAKLTQDLPEVLECHRVTGEVDYIAKLAFSSVSHLETFTDRLVPYGKSVTALALSSPVTHRVIRPENLGAAEAAEESPFRRG